MRRIVFACWMLLFAGGMGAAPAADINGKWRAETLLAPSGSEQPVPTTFTFRVEGGKLTGTVASERGSNEIVDGKVDGDSITFAVPMMINNNRARLVYDGRITADGLDFISKFEGGDRSDHFVAKRIPD